MLSFPPASLAASTKALHAAQQALSEAPAKRRRSKKAAEPAPQAKLVFAPTEKA